jgi:hypothetical protein
MSAILAPEKPQEAPPVRKRKKRKNTGERPPQNKGSWVLMAGFVAILLVSVAIAYSFIV